MRLQWGQYVQWRSITEVHASHYASCCPGGPQRVVLSLFSTCFSFPVKIASGPVIWKFARSGVSKGTYSTSTSSTLIVAYAGAHTHTHTRAHKENVQRGSEVWNDSVIMSSVWNIFPINLLWQVCLMGCWCSCVSVDCVSVCVSVCCLAG